MDLTQRVGQRLRALRLRRNHTLAAVACDLGMSPSALSAYELGQRPITLDLLERFAEYYGVAPEAVVSSSRGAASG